MKLTTLFAAVALAALTACASTEFAERSETVERTLTVREIDRENRSFQVAGGGQTFKLTVSDAVVNFDQIEVGDVLNIVYTESVAVGMALPGDDGETFVLEDTLTAREGDKPGIAQGEMVSTVVDFVSYDPATQVAVVTANDGTIYATKVRRELRAFAAARQPGDRIVVDMVSGYAVAIEPAG